MKAVLKLSCLVAFSGLLGACATVEHMNWIGVGGSKADGTVILGIDLPAKFGVAEPSATWDIQQANPRCQTSCRLKKLTLRHGDNNEKLLFRSIY